MSSDSGRSAASASVSDHFAILKGTKYIKEFAGDEAAPEERRANFQHLMEQIISVYPKFKEATAGTLLDPAKFTAELDDAFVTITTSVLTGSALRLIQFIAVGRERLEALTKQYNYVSAEDLTVRLAKASRGVASSTSPTSTSSSRRSVSSTCSTRTR
ncbi:MAG: hypothetical protein AAGG50_20675 [Bacteroidota bacterium]